MPAADPGDLVRSERAAHGQPRPVPLDALLADDPELWLATADMGTWLDAHPCECEGLCVCGLAA